MADEAAIDFGENWNVRVIENSKIVLWSKHRFFIWTPSFHCTDSFVASIGHSVIEVRCFSIGHAILQLRRIYSNRWSKAFNRCPLCVFFYIGWWASLA